MITIDKTIRLILRASASAAKVISPAFSKLWKVKVEKNISYGPLSEQLLDFYIPTETKETLLPVVLHIHGGGFQFYSKETHAHVAAKLAEAGFAVFSIDYRLAPQAPFPAGFEDACQAYEFIVQNAKKFPIDLSRLYFMGESAGANLCLATALWVFDEKKKILPKKIVAHCGMFEVSNSDRFLEDEHFKPKWFIHRVRRISVNYIHGGDFNRPASQLISRYANLLTRFGNEVSASTQNLDFKNFPKIFLPVGGSDPILSDTLILTAYLKQLCVQCQHKVYSGEPHAFYALPFRKKYTEVWEDLIQFLKE